MNSKTDLIKKLRNYETNLKKYHASLIEESQHNRKQFQKFSRRKGYSVYSRLCEENALKNEEIIKQLEELFPDLFHNI